MSLFHWPVRRRISLVASIVGAVVSTGCASGIKNFSVEKLGAAFAGDPTNMLVLINQTNAEEGGRAVQKGMLCRIYFFAGDSSKPVETEGELLITAADMNSEADQKRPSTVYNVKPDKFPSHQRADIVGKSYVFWLPLQSTPGGQLAVKAFFKTASGKQIESNAVMVDIAPIKMSSEQTERTNDSSILGAAVEPTRLR